MPNVYLKKKQQQAGDLKCDVSNVSYHINNITNHTNCLCAVCYTVSLCANGSVAVFSRENKNFTQR